MEQLWLGVTTRIEFVDGVAQSIQQNFYVVFPMSYDLFKKLALG